MSALLETNDRNSRTVIFVRHFETPLNGEDVSRGWSATPIEENTFSKAKKLGKVLKGQIDGIVVSDLLRTLQTAHYISIGSDVPIIKTTTILHTWNTGDLTGEPTEKVDPMLEKLARTNPDKELKGGESFNAFKYRFLLGLISILNECEDDLCFVAHGRNLALLNAWALKDYNEELDVDTEHIGYEPYEPGTAHIFTISCPLLHRKSIYLS